MALDETALRAAGLPASLISLLVSITKAGERAAAAANSAAVATDLSPQIAAAVQVLQDMEMAPGLATQIGEVAARVSQIEIGPMPVTSLELDENRLIMVMADGSRIEGPILPAGAYDPVIVLSGGSLTVSGEDLVITPPVASIQNGAYYTPGEIVVSLSLTRDELDVTANVQNGIIPNAPAGEYIATWTASDGVLAPATKTVSRTVTVGDVPNAFATNQWSVNTGANAGEIVINVSVLPANNGSSITAIEYLVGTTWAALDGAGVGSRTVMMPEVGAYYEISLRAWNAAGPSGPSAAKGATSGGQVTAAPAVTSPPTIAGNTTVGSVLGGTVGSATGIPAPTASTRWLRNGTAISGQTGNTLDTTGFAAGDVILRRTTWTNTINGQAQTTTGTSDPFVLTVQPELLADSVTPNPLVAGQPAQIVFNAALTEGPTAPGVVFSGSGTTWTFTVPADITSLTIGATRTGWKSYGDTLDVEAPDAGAFDLTSKNYPTAIGPITYNVASQFSGTVTAWAVSGSDAASIANGVLTIDSDSMSPGDIELLITATGATSPKGRLRLTWEPINITFDGTNITSVSIPDDTPPDTEITFTPTGGVHNNRTIIFRPSDLTGLVNGAGFFALPPLITISTDTGAQGSVNQGDIISLTAPALAIFTGTTTPFVGYSARDNNGEITNNISFPYTVPVNPTGTFFIRAYDGHGHTINSQAAPVAAAATFSSNFADAAYDTNPDLSASPHYALWAGTTFDVNASNHAELRTALGTPGFGTMKFVNLDDEADVRLWMVIGQLNATSLSERLFLRGRASTGNNVLLRTRGSTGGIELIVNAGSVAVSNTTATVGVTAGDRFDLVMNGTTASALKNGEPITALTNIDISAVPLTSPIINGFGNDQQNSTTVKSTFAQVGYEVLA